MKRGNQFFVKQCAIFMIFLILTMPFVSALSIAKVTVAGSDGIENIMSAEGDYFTATVETSEEINANQLQIQYTKKEAFDQCSGTTCTYASSNADRSGQEMSYTIQLLDSSIIVDEVTGTLLIDENKPEIIDYAVEKSGEELSISYEVEDTACDDCSGCSGIDYISIMVDETETQQINIASQCSVEDEFETSISELNIADGDHKICLVAYDNVGHESDDACEAVSVDSEAPHFETNSLQITEAVTGNTVEYIGNDAILVNIKINVTDTSLDTTAVSADLSALNSIIGETYNNISGSCGQDYDDETMYVCSWNNLYIEDVSGGLTLSFFASDTEGNQEVYSPVYTLTKDDTAPTVVQVYKQEQTGSDTVYIKDGLNSVYADFDATGSAMAFEKAYMTFNLANMNKKKADSCWENGAYWTCNWNFTMSYSGTSSTSLYINAEDDAGNAMEQYEIDVEADATEPEITSLSKSLDCPTGSDVLLVEVNATDDSEELFVSLYGEDVRNSNEPITEKCSMIAEGEFTCLISINDLVSYPEDEDVKIEVSDSAGNIAEDELDVSVCELESTGTPNLVTVYVDDTSPVDKLTLSYIDYPLYVPMTFSMTSGAHIVSKTASCEEASMYFIDQSEKETIAVLTIPKQAVPNATAAIQLDCAVSLTMQYGNNVYMNPEIENITINVDLYGTPLGSIEDSIVQKIEMQKMGIAEAQEKIDKWVTANRVLGGICGVHSVLVKANAIMAIVHWAGIGLKNYAPTTAAGEAIVQTSSIFDKFIVKWIHKPGFPSLSFGTLLKWLCVIYSGKMCEGFTTLENEFIIKAREYGSEAYYDQYTNGKWGSVSSQQEQANKFKKWLMFTDWDPYKSIHTAANCFYIDAIIYNLRKERQINCMYTKCLEENAKIGLPTDICETQYKERECLYVDGAAWQAAGWIDFFHFVQLNLNSALANLDWWAYSISYFAICSPTDLVDKTNTANKAADKAKEAADKAKEATDKAKEATDKAKEAADTAAKNANEAANKAKEAADKAQNSLDIYNALCHTIGSGVSLVEVGFLDEGKIVDFDFQANLEGTDYCVGYG